MKPVKIICLAAAVVLAAGCSSSAGGSTAAAAGTEPAETSAGASADAAAAAETAAPAQTSSADVSAEVLAVYQRDVISRVANMEGFQQGDGLGPTSYQLDGHYVIGDYYAFLDLNGDGTPELLFGGPEAIEDAGNYGDIFAVYTIRSGSAEFVQQFPEWTYGWDAWLLEKDGTYYLDESSSQYEMHWDIFGFDADMNPATVLSIHNYSNSSDDSTFGMIERPVTYEELYGSQTKNVQGVETITEDQAKDMVSQYTLKKITWTPVDQTTSSLAELKDDGTPADFQAVWNDFHYLGSTAGGVEVLTDGLNIRKTPSTSGEKIGTCTYGSIYNIFETADADGYTWYRIGRNAWIASNEGQWTKKYTN